MFLAVSIVGAKLISLWFVVQTINWTMDDFLENKLNDRRAQHSFRSLKLPGNKVDFCSNDYLGIAKNHLLKTVNADLSHGSGGSRLLAGNYSLIEDTEQLIASFHEANAALIYNSGYDANLGL